MTTILTDRGYWSRGPRVVSNGPWAADIDPSITDYGDTAIIRDDGSILFSWSFPNAPSPLGVYGYNYVSYGQYWQERVERPVAPLQLGKLTLFDFAYDLTMMQPDSANLLIEFFARTQPTATSPLTAEIGWLMQMPPATLAWFAAGQSVGTFTSRGGHQWEVRSQASGAAGLYIMIAPADRKPRHAMTVDALAAVRFLIGKGLVDPAHWINGHALGFEPVGGAGAAIVRKYQVALT